MAEYKNVENIRNLFDEEFKKTRQLIQQGETHLDNLAEGFLEADRVLLRIPTADVVEVVRCKDCKHFMEYANEGKVEGADGDCFIRMSYSLDHQFYAVKCDDFCSYGIKRGEDNAKEKE